jgi:micrococcal nuclease
VSKHWRPQGKVVRIRPVGRRKWTTFDSYAATGRRSGPSGATILAVLAAAGFAGVAVGLSQAAGEAKAPALATSSGTIAHFGYCYTGGGTNCVVDGDTFYIDSEKVRIASIDAPETHPSRCAEEARLGNAATEQLHTLLNSGAVTMTGIDRDRDGYGRLLRNVAVDGQDVGEAMISAGVARAYGSGRKPWC